MRLHMHGVGAVTHRLTQMVGYGADARREDGEYHLTTPNPPYTT
jgi:hypothetical protein